MASSSNPAPVASSTFVSFTAGDDAKKGKGKGRGKADSGDDEVDDEEEKPAKVKRRKKGG